VSFSAKKTAVLGSFLQIYPYFGAILRVNTQFFYILARNLASFYPHFLRVTPQILKTQKEDYYAETSFAQDYGRP
jgi:hypothetical protein